MSSGDAGTSGDALYAAPADTAAAPDPMALMQALQAMSKVSASRSSSVKCELASECCMVNILVWYEVHCQLQPFQLQGEVVVVGD